MLMSDIAPKHVRTIDFVITNESFKAQIFSHQIKEGGEIIFTIDLPQVNRLRKKFQIRNKKSYDDSLLLVKVDKNISSIGPKLIHKFFNTDPNKKTAKIVSLDDAEKILDFWLNLIKEELNK